MEEHKDSKEVLEQMNENPQEYSFLQETIKDEDGSKKRFRKSVGRIAVLGLVLGMTACIGFGIADPFVDKIFQNDPKKITIPKEEEDTSHLTEEQPEASGYVLNEESYRQMHRSLNAVVSEAQKSVVNISVVAGNLTLSENSQESAENVAGLIIADNGRELLILGKSPAEKTSKEYRITFADGKEYSGILKKQDYNLGLAIYAVNSTAIEDSTKARIKEAKLGSSLYTEAEDTAIVLGNPFGQTGTIGYGLVDSCGVLELADGQYQRIETDITGSLNGSGFVLNLNSEVIAVIHQDISEGTLAGYGISDIKGVIELLSNGQDVPYIGIRGQDVTEDIEQEGVPQGVYIKEVEVDSPAMKAGIQSGDVITSIDGTEVTTLAAYHSALMERKTGSKVKIKGQRQGSEGYVDIDFDVTIGKKE